MTPVTIDRKDMQEAKKACVSLGFECYFMDKKDDTDRLTLVIDSDKAFEIWYIARTMQIYVNDKMYS